MSPLARLYARLELLARLPVRVASAAAPRLEAQARAAATTSRGYVPPLTVSASAEGVALSGPAWAVEKATADGGQALGRILDEEAQRAFREG